MHTTLCLTATIAPHTHLVARADVALRLADYKAALEYYLTQTALPIAFIENSPYDLDGDPDFDRYLTTGRLTVHRYTHHADTARGKGFQEFYMLDQFVRDHLTTPRFVKVTGRYLALNLPAMLPKFNGHLHIDMHRNMKVALTSLFVAERELYLTHLAGLYALSNDAEGRYIEHVVYNALQTNLALASHASLLPQNARFEGVSGSYGGSLARNKYKMMVRSLERKVNRGLGIRQFWIEY